MSSFGRRSYLGQCRRERRVVHEDAAAAVIQEIEQLLSDVAVVHVERCDTGLVRPEHAFEVLVAVVQVDAEVVLTGFVSVEKLPTDGVRDASADQIVGETTCAFGDVAPGPRCSPPYDAWTIGNRSGERLVNVWL